MKLAVGALIFSLLLAPFQAALAAKGWERNEIVITASQVSAAGDIEAAIIKITAGGTRAGTVVLDGKEGVFNLAGEDKSINIFVSNLALRGVHNAMITGCDDGIFFDDLGVRHVRVEGINFVCSGDGVEADGTYQDVTLRGNLFQVGANGISILGPSEDWLITDNLIEAGGDGISLNGGKAITVTRNHVAGNIAVLLSGAHRNRVQNNALNAQVQGVLLRNEANRNMVQNNTILGVSAAGIALEPGVTGNKILANRVLCAAESHCLTVDAAPETIKVNKIAGNRP